MIGGTATCIASGNGLSVPPIAHSWSEFFLLPSCAAARARSHEESPLYLMHAVRTGHGNCD
jgi:hypothetical protein